MKSRQRTRYLTPDEEARLLEHLPAGIKSDAIVFLLDTGARRGEVIGLQWDDLKHASALDRVTFARTKNGKPRTVPLTPRAKDCLVRARAEGRSRPFPVAPRPLWVAFKKAVKLAGLDNGSHERLCLHHLRHSCASRLVQRGASIEKVQRWLGHSSINMTMRYSHLAPNALDDLVVLL